MVAGLVDVVDDC